MEFMAWFSHKYIMHGFLWILHKDHHKKDHKSWFERNDLFFIFYAVISTGLVMLWGKGYLWAGLPIGVGIFVYGVTYFIVHDIFIHRRIKIFSATKNKYFKGIMHAHRLHHAKQEKENCEYFGMLFVPLSVFKSLK